MLSGRSHFNGGLEWLEMVLIFFFTCCPLSSTFLFVLPSFFHFVKKISSSSSRSAVNLFIIIIVIIIIHANFFFVLTKKKKTFPSFRARIHLLRSQPTQSSNHFPIFFFSTMHNLSEFFLFRLQVFFFPLYLSSCPSFLSSFSFVTYDFFFNLLLLSLSFFFLYPILLLYLIPQYSLSQSGRPRPSSAEKQNFLSD